MAVELGGARNDEGAGDEEEPPPPPVSRASWRPKEEEGTKPVSWGRRGVGG